ncbi:MAG: integration host factor subunit beta [Deltaproteobacteria bacterium]|nr:integration host factor subunit beta [Deltaproteobacteria bacterium]
MLKRELIAALAKRHKELKIKDVDLMARLVFETMAEALIQGRGIELRGFGSFHLRRYAPRAARNPGSGQKVFLGYRRGVLFRAARTLRERLKAR